MKTSSNAGAFQGLGRSVLLANVHEAGHFIGVQHALTWSDLQDPPTMALATDEEGKSGGRPTATKDGDGKGRGRQAKAKGRSFSGPFVAATLGPVARK